MTERPQPTPPPALEELGIAPAVDAELFLVPELPPVLRSEARRRWVEDIAAVANDPERRQEALRRLKEFAESEVAAPEDMQPLHDELMAAHEAARFARDVMSGFQEPQLVRRIIARGARSESIQAAISQENGWAAHTFAGELWLAQAVHGALQLAADVYAEQHGARYRLAQ